MEKVHVSLIAGKCLVFDLDDVKRLRSLGIGGVLNGTLPIAPQQNIFLGLPLQLMVEEVIWLIENDYIYLVPEKEFINGLIDDLTSEDIKLIQENKYKDFEVQKELKIKEKNEIISKKNIINKEAPNELMILQSLMITIKNTPNELPNYELFNSIFNKNSKLIKSLKYNKLDYKIFKYLKSLNYFLAPGLRFGGKFIGYPGDPLRYHAHLIINSIEFNNDINLIDIVSGGRLATGVKKIWLIGSEKDNDDDDDDNETVCFSVEWAGFG